MPDGTPIVQIAHINAMAPGGPRFDPQLSRNEIDSPSNLIVVCPNHHYLIDSSPSEYTSEKLHSIRSAHIQRVAGERRVIAAFDRERPSDAIPTRITQFLSIIEANVKQWSVRRSGVTKLEQTLNIWRNRHDHFLGCARAATGPNRRVANYLDHRRPGLCRPPAFRGRRKDEGGLHE